MSSAFEPALLDGARRPSSQVRIETILCIAFATVAIATQVWQPFVLGFYHDDWALFVQPRLHPADTWFFGPSNPDRPGFALLTKAIVTLWNGEPATLHLMKIAITSSACAAIALTALTYQRAFGVTSPALAISGAAFWLVAPWSLGYSLWPTAAFANMAVLLLGVSTIALERWIATRAFAALILSVLTYAASLSFYQSTWLAIFPFLAILGLRDVWQRRPSRPAIIAFVLLGAVQIAAAAQSFLSSPKAPNPQVVHLFLENLKRVSKLGVSAFGSTGNNLMLAAVGCALLVVCLRAWSRGPQSRIRLIGGVLLFLSGIGATSAVYAAANYGFDTVGVFSRTTQMVNVWIAIAGALLFAPPPGDESRVRYIGPALSLAIVVACCAAYWPAARPWLRSWEMQRAILDKTGPLAAQVRDGDVVLTNVPVQVDGVTVFGAPWDITAAFLVKNATTLPQLAYRTPSIQIVPFGPLDMSWTPGKFTVMPGWTIDAKRLLVWNWRTGAISTVDHPVATQDELGALFSPD